MTSFWVRAAMVTGVFGLGSVVARPALAEEPAATVPAEAAPPATPPPATPPVAPVAPDIVRLKNGGIMRGTISELVPGEYVTIILITGETRKFPIAEVRRAGRADAPANVDPPMGNADPAETKEFPSKTHAGESGTMATIHAAEARVTVVSEPDSSTLFLRSAAAGYNSANVSGYDEVCTAPCDVSLPAGTRTFAVSAAGHAPREADAVTLPAGKSTLKAKYVSRIGLRIGLGIASGVVMAGAIPIAVAGAEAPGKRGAKYVPVASAFVAVGIIGLTVTFLIPDGAEVTIIPGAPSAREGHTAYASTRLEDKPLVSSLAGLTLHVTF